MKVFISWSGEKSQRAAIIFRDFIQNVIQAVEPFVSSEDINKGQRWHSMIAEALQQCDFGVICVTAENLLEPWLHFEVGAMTRSVSVNQAAPLLIDITFDELTGPLSQFQAAEIRHEEILKVVRSINTSVQPLPLSEDALERSFDKWWPDLESELGRLNATYLPSNRPARTDRELLEEILGYVRKSHTLGSPKRSKSIVRSNSISEKSSRVHDQIVNIAKRHGVRVSVEFDRRYKLVNVVASASLDTHAETEISDLVREQLNMKTTFQWQLPLELFAAHLD